MSNDNRMYEHEGRNASGATSTEKADACMVGSRAVIVHQYDRAGESGLLKVDIVAKRGPRLIITKQPMPVRPRQFH